MTLQAARPQNEIQLLFSCVGRRVELLQAFRRAAERLGLKLRLIGADQTATAPGLWCVDEAVLVPPIQDAGYVPALLEIVRRTQAAALIPTIDSDLPVLAAHLAEFLAANCQPLIAEPEVIRVCRDKLETFLFLSRAGIDTPFTCLPDEALQSADRKFPLFLKPRFGSASVGVRKIEDQYDLEYFARKVQDPIVQEFVPGVEHTIDVYVGLNGAPRCAVPRRRIEVRSGEVSKGVVVKDAEIMAAAKRVVEALGASLRGLVTLQCMVTPERRIRFIEINPRFGGGAPLGIAAGADYPSWLLQELLGRPVQIAFDGFTAGLAMLRYDWSVFAPVDSKQAPQIQQALNHPPPFAG